MLDVRSRERVNGHVGHNSEKGRYNILRSDVWQAESLRRVKQAESALKRADELNMIAGRELMKNNSTLV